MLSLAHIPGPPLDDFVERLWMFADAPPHERERILPSGTVELVVNLREDEIRIYDPLRPQNYTRHPGAVVSGAFRRYFVIDTRVHAAMVGVHFRPGGAFPFFRLPLHELCDRHVDLRSLWGADAGELRERLCAAATPGQRFRLLESALLRHLDPARQPRGAVQLAVDWLGQTPAGVGAVVQRVGLSHRRFIDLFTSEVGMTPKLFGRIVRFQQALGRAGRLATPAWADLARQCGYFDQSHLVRDFLAFSGLSPAGYLRQRSARVKASHVPAPP